MKALRADFSLHMMQQDTYSEPQMGRLSRCGWMQQAPMYEALLPLARNKAATLIAVTSCAASKACKQMEKSNTITVV